MPCAAEVDAQRAKRGARVKSRTRHWTDCLFLAPVHPQKWTLNQSLPDRAARGTIGFRSLLRLASESVNEFGLPRLQLSR